jgi:hypothetical protein
MLQPAQHVPGVLQGEVLGVNGGKVWPVLAGDRLTLWAVRGGDMVGVELDAAGADALLQLLGEARGLMRAG